MTGDAQIAVIEGDLSEEESFTFRLRLRLPDTGLEAYARLGRPSGHQEVTHEPA